MSIFVTTQRVLKTGFINFWRNGVVSLASVLVFTVTLFVIGVLILGSAVLNASLEQLKDKVDVTVFFSIDADPASMDRVTQQVQSLPEVESAVFKSREEVLTEFREEHADDSLILQSLDELGADNPLRAELNIKASDPSQYEGIVNFLESESSLSIAGGSGVIDKVNFEDNRDAIERFTQIISSIEELGLYISILAALITVLVVFNTIRLGIYTAREEISVMRLVGASNSYIRGPFIIEGVMYGVMGALFTLAILYPVTAWISQGTGNFYGGIDLFNYYINNLPYLFAVLVGTGIALGIISSALAVRRYLKV